MAHGGQADVWQGDPMAMWTTAHSVSCVAQTRETNSHTPFQWSK